jgi:hypothetical protein
LIGPRVKRPILIFGLADLAYSSGFDQAEDGSTPASITIPPYLATTGEIASSMPT